MKGPAPPDEQLRMIRGILAAQGAVIESLVRTAPNKDVLETAISDSLQFLARVHAFADSKTGKDELFDEAYEGYLKSLLAAMKPQKR
jgi:hypothetical protein